MVPALWQRPGSDTGVRRPVRPFARLARLTNLKPPFRQRAGAAVELAVLAPLPVESLHLAGLRDRRHRLDDLRAIARFRPLERPPHQLAGWPLAGGPPPKGGARARGARPPRRPLGQADDGSAPLSLPLPSL